MKKILSVLLTVLAVFSLLTGAYAADDSRRYDFTLSCDGESSVTAEKDSIVTVTLGLERTDSTAPAEISAFQTELCYDDEVLEYVGCSSRLPGGMEAVDICTDEFGRRLRVSYALGGPSELFGQKTELMSFDFKVLKEVGNTRLTQEYFLVSSEDGTDTYVSTAEDFLVVTERFFIPEYSVVFEALNGQTYDEVLIIKGETVSEPETIPIREGYEFSGWYTDNNTFTERYDFSRPVEGSMTLYAKWNELEKPFNTWVLYAASVPLLIGLIVFIILRKRDKEKQE